VPASPKDSIRYWEPRRIAYNLALLLLCAWWVMRTWPHFEPAMTIGNLGRMLILAVLANVCYSTAYVADLALLSALDEPARGRSRAALFIVGTLFALLLATYWIGDEIYPYAQSS
jgi:hypothetical protein